MLCALADCKGAHSSAGGRCLPPPAPLLVEGRQYRTSRAALSRQRIARGKPLTQRRDEAEHHTPAKPLDHCCPGREKETKTWLLRPAAAVRCGRRPWRVQGFRVLGTLLRRRDLEYPSFSEQHDNAPATGAQAVDKLSGFSGPNRVFRSWVSEGLTKTCYPKIDGTSPHLPQVCRVPGVLRARPDGGDIREARPRGSGVHEGSPLPQRIQHHHLDIARR